MPGNPGEAIAQDKSHKRVDSGLLYTDPSSRTAKIRNVRVTDEGFKVAGHAHFIQTPYDGSTVLPESPPGLDVEVDISERGPVIITVENGQNGNVGLQIFGLYETASGSKFSLVNFVTLTPGTQKVTFVSDPWKILLFKAFSKSPGQTAGFVVKVQEQT